MSMEHRRPRLWFLSGHTAGGGCATRETTSLRLGRSCQGRSAGNQSRPFEDTQAHQGAYTDSAEFQQLHNEWRAIMNLINHQFRLAARPVGLPKRSDWNYTEEPVRQPGPSELLVKILYLSLDPAMRGWMNEGKSYIPPVGIGEVMRAGGVGQVTASGNPAFGAGDHVTGLLGMQEYALIDAQGAKGLTKVDPKLVPLPVYVGALGITGLTAYFGLLEVGQAKAGDTVVVSGAAGATGMMVGQIAKIKGCRAVGIAGGAEKCNYVVKELGFDAIFCCIRPDFHGHARSEEHTSELQSPDHLLCRLL